MRTRFVKPITVQVGVGLVELMVSITLGMLVVGASIGVYISAFGANSNALRMARLNNDLRAAMTFIVRDLRRAGYDADAQGGPAGQSDFRTITLWNGVRAGGAAITSGVGKSITFTYDRDSDGILDDDDDFYDDGDAVLEAGEGALGFSYDETNDAIETRTGAANWEDITDPAVVRITAFAITEASPTAFSVTNAGVTSTIQVRSFTITIEGELVRDATVKRAIKEVVRLRSEVLT